MHDRTIVVDVSVAIKWLHEEPETDAALALLDEINDGRLIAIAPDLIIYEVVNAIVRGIGKPAPEASEAIDVLARIPWQLVSPSPALMNDAMLFASERPKLSVYDAAYVAVASTITR